MLGGEKVSMAFFFLFDVNLLDNSENVPELEFGVRNFSELHLCALIAGEFSKGKATTANRWNSTLPVGSS